ncbi:MAG: hypothetical protein M0P16_00515 [Syntrophales bacterium]|jgi:hypothetical protein|nr:hypothetical protein [Syntrophales bacterium]MCK9390269.1 hypothetical protein [Syntrophales bacterium]
MTALTQDKKLEYKEGVEVPVPIKTLTEIFAGSFLCVDATGWGVPGDDAAGLIFQGISRTYVPSTSGNGSATAIARRRGLVKATLATAITQANVGDNVFLVDDQTVDLIGNVNNGIFCGVIAEYIDTTHAYIDIEPAIKQADVASHIADGSNAHAASAISAVAGGLAIPANAQLALAEIYQHIKSIQGFIPIPLTSFRELAAGVFINAAGNGGILATDTTPILTNIADGDAMRLAWAAGNTDQIAAQVILPPDIDLTANLVVHFLCSKDADANVVHIDGEAYFGESDGDCFPAAGASNLITQVKAELTATIALADLPANQTDANMTLVVMPEAHAGDAVYLHGVWLEYKKKLLTS